MKEQVSRQINFNRQNQETSKNNENIIEIIAEERKEFWLIVMLMLKGMINWI
jgi:hypothetical protein